MGNRIYILLPMYTNVYTVGLQYKRKQFLFHYLQCTLLLWTPRAYIYARSNTLLLQLYYSAQNKEIPFHCSGQPALGPVSISRFVHQINRHFQLLILFVSFFSENSSDLIPALATLHLPPFQEYTNTVCWVSDTYYVPFERDMPKVEEPRQMISYYQWVPLILLVQAGLFFCPYIVWRFLNRWAAHLV